ECGGRDGGSPRVPREDPRHGRPWRGFAVDTRARFCGKACHRNPAQAAELSSEIPRGTSIYRITIFRRDGGGLAYPASVNWFRLTRIRIGAFGYTGRSRSALGTAAR